MSDVVIPIFDSHDELIPGLSINTQRARALKGICKKISTKTGVSVREAEIVNYLIDYGLPRLIITDKGITLE